MLVLLILIFVVLFMLQVPGLVKKKMWRELAVYLTIFSLGVLYSFGLMYDWRLPNPTQRMEYLFAPLWEYLEKVSP